MLKSTFASKSPFWPDFMYIWIYIKPSLKHILSFKRNLPAHRQRNWEKKLHTLKKNSIVELFYTVFYLWANKEVLYVFKYGMLVCL